MNHKQDLKAWVPWVDFLADALGSTCEVVLHDLLDIEHSIVAIRNNHVTGRQVGDSLSDFALEIIQEHAHNKKSYLASYYGSLEENGKILRLSSFFIYDEEGRPIGMLALNMDFSVLEEARDIINRFIHMEALVPVEKQTGKSMHFNLSEDYMPSMVARTIAESGVEPARMTADEKRGIVESLQWKGVFLLKGAITEVAKKLEVSEQTVYRYLKDI
ncbi:MAG: PAS domain-containing protein [Synergistaceae bacterium]|jgi:predicted transcriptional regulator YheO|nr:PAS domain-containing protein [Synergistaceae bacterium]